MEKYDYISELAENTAFEIVQNQEEWKKYLTTAARLYKYPFREQLLIYAQRPDATACASIEIWNERMHCWVKKGAKGIALLDDADRGKKLKYVFDVADVYAAKQTGRYPQTWKLYPEHEASVLNHLEQIYGATDPQNSFEERVVEIVERISAEHADQLLGSLQHTIAGSPLADLDETSLDLHLKNTLSESVSFTILSACGIEVQKYSSKFEFSYIHEFDTMDTLSILGDAANELAKPVLLEISKTVRAYEKLRFQKKEIENASHPEYNTLKRESEANNQQTAERGNNDESELREKWRLHDSDVEGQRSTGRDSNEVRNDAGNLSQGESERNLFSYAPEGDVERTSVNDPEPGRRTDGDFDPADGKERWSNRTAQGTGSDDLGETNEQYKESGRGDRAERTDLHAVEDSTSSTPQETFTQLSLFPSVEEQLGTVVTAEAGTKYIQPTDFSLHQDALTEILRSGGGKRNSRRRIYAKYTAGYDADNMINFLKNEYGQTGKGFSVDGNPVSVWFNEQGMRAAYGMQAMENPVLSLGWKDIEKYIRSMVENGSYISASEAARVAEGERARVADQIYFFMRDGINESYPEIGLEWLGTYPENAKKLTELLSDHTGREQLQSILKAADLQLKSGEKVLQWKYVKRPEYLLSEIRDLDQEPLKFPALATGNPHIKEKMDLDIQVSRLKLMKSNHMSQKYRLEDNITRIYPQQIEFLEEFIQAFQRDIEQYNEKLAANKQHFFMNVDGQLYTEKKDAGLAIIDMCKRLNGINSTADIGEYLGFKLNLTFDSFNNRFLLNIKGYMSHRIEIGSDPIGTITRINHLLTAMPGKLQEAHTKLENINVQLETAKIEVTKEFPQEAELAQKQKRLSELNALLNMDQKESDTLALEVDETEDSALNHTASKNDAKEADLAIIPAEYSHKKAVKKKPKLL